MPPRELLALASFGMRLPLWLLTAPFLRMPLGKGEIRPESTYRHLGLSLLSGVSDDAHTQTPELCVGIDHIGCRGAAGIARVTA